MSEEKTSDNQPQAPPTARLQTHSGDPSAEDVADWLERCRRGDAGAESALFQSYFERLLRLVRRRLSARLARRFDAEDVVLSAWRSFFLGARVGKFSIETEENLWSLLATLTLRKVSKQVRRHQAEVRSADRDVPLESSSPPRSILADAETAVAIADDIENLLARLDLTDQEILIQSLQGADSQTISRDLNCSDRTVRRALERIRQEAVRTEAPATAADSPRPGILASKSTRVSPPNQTPQSGLAPTHQETDITLQRLAGQGAFTKVYRALDRKSGRIVAAKFLRPNGWREPRVVASLLREYETLRELRHPGIVGVEGWGTTRAGATFLILEWIDGPDLSEWREERPPLRNTLRVLLQTAEALAAAHARGILHGDLKPSNLLRRAEGSIVLADFGLAVRVGRDDSRWIGGTTGFLAPELLAGQTELTIQTDIFSFGQLARDLLGNSPAPAAIESILNSCREASPANRPKDLGNLIRELRSAI